MSDASDAEPELNIDSPDDYLDCQWLPREEVTPNDWNPNRIEEDEQRMLVKSIKNNGWTRPIVVHASELYIIDGEQRWTVVNPDVQFRIDGENYSVAEDESITPDDVPAGYVPVFGITVSEDEAKVSTIQHNRARGFVDYNSLYDYLEEFQNEDLLDDLSAELDFEREDLLRIVDQETVSEAVGSNPELSDPWEPRDIRDLDEEDIETTTRTAAMADTASTDTDAEAIDRISVVLSEREREKVESVFGEEDTAENLMRYIRYIDANDLISTFQDTVGIDPDPEYPHPDEIDYSDDEDADETESDEGDASDEASSEDASGGET